MRQFSHSVHRPRGRRGFSAVEMIAVATVIALLSLILIPILRNRVAQARVVAANDDMRGLENAISLAHADTQQYFRLQDYDNTTDHDEDDIGNIEYPTVELPRYFWGALAPMADARRAALVKDTLMSSGWDGPYVSFKNHITIEELATSYPNMATDLHQGTVDWRGPVFYDGNASGDPLDDDNVDELDDRYPVDPWGGPYLFFAPGILRISGVTTEETDYSTSVIYSMGPNGVPGDVPTPQPEDYLRETGVLGTGDDLTWSF